MKPTAPIALHGGSAGASAHLRSHRVDVSEATRSRLADACASLTTDPAELAESSRDWWPLAMTWALDGEVAGLASVVARPSSADEVAAVLAVCNADSVPVTAAGGRSGVLGGSVPVFGGVVLDLCGIEGIVDVDTTSLVLDVRAGTFGNDLEAELQRDHGVTVGHWPQSIDLSTVGGWLACRGAGQMSTRYGKIEDIVVGLDVVLADGRRIVTGGAPRAAVGPDLNQLFVGSEGTLGIITGARLRLHPAPATHESAAFSLAAFTDGLEVCRRLLRADAHPAVLRLYDATEAQRNYQTGDIAVLLARDEGDRRVVAPTMEVVRAVAAEVGATTLDAELVDRWMDHRNDVSALEALISKGFVVDTMEVSGRWRDLPAIYQATVAAISGVEGTIAASAHCSHSYVDGACLYFTFGGAVGDAGDKDAYYRTVWDAGQRAVLAHGGALSHHHGVGLNRSRFMADALGPSFEVLVAVKRALDPGGILNPGKLGLPSPFGEVPWP